MAIKDINAQELSEMIKNQKETLEIIDVRQPMEYKIIHIKDSKLIPMNEVMGRMDEINFDKTVVVICRSGSRSSMIANLISANTGKEIINLEHGIDECYHTWKGENLEIDEKEINLYF